MDIASYNSFFNYIFSLYFSNSRRCFDVRWA